jgi:hypothetical protein
MYAPLLNHGLFDITEAIAAGFAHFPLAGRAGFDVNPSARRSSPAILGLFLGAVIRLQGEVFGKFRSCGPLPWPRDEEVRNSGPYISKPERSRPRRMAFRTDPGRIKKSCLPIEPVCAGKSFYPNSRLVKKFQSSIAPSHHSFLKVDTSATLMARTVPSVTAAKPSRG